MDSCFKRELQGVKRNRFKPHQPSSGCSVYVWACTVLQTTANKLCGLFNRPVLPYNRYIVICVYVSQ